MEAKELAALLQINPDMDVCIKEDKFSYFYSSYQVRIQQI